jgi:four helix bundle protein
MNPTPTGPRFLTYDRALEALRLVRAPLAQLRRHSRSLTDQLERAATSVLLNLAEGSQRRGADRTHFYRIAAGSAAEVGAGLDAAVALGFAEPTEVAAAQDHFRQVVAMLRAITR